MSLRFHEIAEGTRPILNPFAADQLDLLGRICAPARGARQLDLACGRGEMLCRFARDHGVQGVGVDISEVFLEAAYARARALSLERSVSFVQGEAADYVRRCEEHFDLVSCIGATWIGGGLEGTLALLSPRLRDRDSLLLVGEPFWQEALPPGYPESWNDFASLEETRVRLERSGLELIEMVAARREQWDRYEAAQWKHVSDYLRAHPEDPEADALRSWIDGERRAYTAYGRRYLEWAVFVLRPAA